MESEEVIFWEHDEVKLKVRIQIQSCCPWYGFDVTFCGKSHQSCSLSAEIFQPKQREKEKRHREHVTMMMKLSIKEINLILWYGSNSLLRIYVYAFPAIRYMNSGHIRLMERAIFSKHERCESHAAVQSQLSD